MLEISMSTGLLPPELLLLLKRFISSNPCNLLTSFTTSFALSVASSKPSVKLLAPSVAPTKLFAIEAVAFELSVFPVTWSMKDLKAFAAICNLEITIFSHFTTGERMFMNA